MLKPRTFKIIRNYGRTLTTSYIRHETKIPIMSYLLEASFRSLFGSPIIVSLCLIRSPNNNTTATMSNTYSRVPRRPRYNVPMMCFLLLLIAMCCQARATISSPLNFRAGANTPLEAGGPLSLFISTIKEARRHLAAAAVARSVSIFVMYPVDTVKTRIQMDQANALRISGLYNGVAGSLLGQVPYG